MPPEIYLNGGDNANFSTGNAAMYFDWVTWSIWSIGLVILLVWIYVPAKEFSQLLKDRRQKSGSPQDSSPAEK